MSALRRIRIDLAYQGTQYHGWQRQRGLPTVQGHLDVAIEKIVGSPALTIGSSRTDTGVHALQQVAAFSTESSIPADTFCRAINAYLPYDIRVLQTQEVPEEFHPIADCVRKKYCYLIDDHAIASPFLNGLVWNYKLGLLDVEKMHNASQFLLGEHDFASFQSQGSPRQSTVRTIESVSVTRCPNFLPFGIFDTSLIAIEVEANGFLYHMVRTIVGTLVQIGNHSRPSDWVNEIITAKDRTAAGPTAPATGLYLMQITLK